MTRWLLQKSCSSIETCFLVFVDTEDTRKRPAEEPVEDEIAKRARVEIEP
jgi:hypothetical protein